jgi:hypothetical protein
VKHISKKTAEKDHKWLLLFYSVPSKPVSSRMKIWRKLVKVGAIPLKGAVYILPYSEEHYELCQWLMSEVSAMGGEGDFVITDEFEMLKNGEIITLFNKQRKIDYGNIEKRLNELEIKVNSIKKGSKAKNVRTIKGQLNRYVEELNDVKKIDFFSSKFRRKVESKIQSFKTEFKKIKLTDTEKGEIEQKISISYKRHKDYSGKTWVTRKKPFVDRMASAWIIKKFIDKKAVFRFIDERERENVDKDSVTYDIREGEITHIGEMCTFEVLVKSFGIKDKRVKDIAELVHQIDMKDDRYSSPEARGIEEILLGIRKTAKGDLEALEKGIAVFEMLYASKT